MIVYSFVGIGNRLVKLVVIVGLIGWKLVCVYNFCVCMVYWKFLNVVVVLRCVLVVIMVNGFLILNVCGGVMCCIGLFVCLVVMVLFL